MDLTGDNRPRELKSVRLDSDVSLFIDQNNARWAITSDDTLSPEMGAALNGRLRVIPDERPFSYLNLELTSRCNMACSYCYRNSSPRGEDMSADTLEAAIGLLIKSASPVKYVGFHGGEPLLRRETIADTVRRHSSDNIRFVIQTNGTLLTPQFVRDMRSHGVGISISLDGHERVHSRNRRGWRQTMRGISVLRDEGYGNVSVRATLTPATCDEIENIVDFFVTNGILFFSLSPVVHQGRGVRANAWSGGAWTEAVVRMAKRLHRWHDQGIFVRESNLDVTLRYIVTSARDYMCCYHPCGAGNLMLAVDTNGNVYPCDHFLDDPSAIIGHVAHDITADRNGGQVLPQMGPFCSDCPFFLFCYGGCPQYRRLTGLWGGSHCAQRDIFEWVFLRLHLDKGFASYAKRVANNGR